MAPADGERRGGANDGGALACAQILRVVQAACKNYNLASDHYRSKPLLYNPHESDRHGHAKVVYVPRIAPPRNKLEPLVRRIEARCGVESMDTETDP